MTSNKLDYYQNKYEVVVRFKGPSPYSKKVTSLVVTVLLVIMYIMFLLFIREKIMMLIQDDYRNILALVAVIFPLGIAVTILHELIHFIPLWWFSKQKPHFHFGLPNSYVELHSGSISRIEGLISYLLPFGVITIVGIVVAFLVQSIMQVALIIVILANFVGCFSDFLCSFRLLTCRGDNIRLAPEAHKKGFKTVFYLDNSNA